GRTLIIGDLHAPHGSEAVLRWAMRFARDFQPTALIQIGDLYDLYNASKFPRSLNLATPLALDKAGGSEAEWMWKGFQRAAPSARCWGLTGNHDERLAKRLLEKCPELETFTDLKSPFEFKGVTTLPARRELVLGNVVFEHGFGPLGSHAR